MKRPYRCLDCRSRMGTAVARKGTCPICDGFNLERVSESTKELNFDDQENGVLAGAGAAVSGDLR